MKPRLNEVIVVEGKKDTEKVQLAVDAQTIETQGIALEPEVIDLIKHAQKTRGVIVLTDPDRAGEMIRRKITSFIPDVKHAFIRADEGMPANKGTLGVEHASIEAIQTALEGLYVVDSKKEAKIPKTFLHQHGLMNHKNSRKLRFRLGEKLRIGYANSKQLQKRLALFNIDEETILHALNEIQQEVENEE